MSAPLPKHLHPPVRAALAVAATAVFLGACAMEEPVGDLPAGHDHAVAGSISPSDQARVLNALRQHTAAWHNIEKAEEAGYTTMVGCIDERVVEGVNSAIARGMGYHPANLALFDDDVDLLSPETLVYGKLPNGELRLAAYDYFVPASPTWPSPADGGVAPMIAELGIPYTWSEVHGGWMFHIWLWWNNPDGMFANFNPTVPQCECDLDPQTGACLP